MGEPNLVQLCQATDGTPIYTAHLQEVMEYTSFAPKRIVEFNMVCQKEKETDTRTFHEKSSSSFSPDCSTP